MSGKRSVAVRQQMYYQEFFHSGFLGCGFRFPARAQAPWAFRFVADIIADSRRFIGKDHIGNPCSRTGACCAGVRLTLRSLLSSRTTRKLPTKELLFDPVARRTFCRFKQQRRRLEYQICLFRIIDDSRAPIRELTAKPIDIVDVVLNDVWDDV
jgi:hypothetical protein